MKEKISSRKLGDIGEDAVCRFLQKNQYEILDRNFTIRGGEIDIVARKNGVVVFVEVKTRKRNSLTSGEEAVDALKRKHIIKAAERYLCGLEKPFPCRFDVAAVELDKNRAVKLKYYVAAFDASK
ncbi:YraN family protein [Ruminococcus sp. Marseille-P6503]|uniref:YraN family protein n=1 Tax=Ruminococcus sp. Marseille-P6503 TaxID=2364796 RepID=UPI000F53C6D0|nr:YraN family protein [Ruminococcus sp. Marseille-P6503]